MRSYLSPESNGENYELSALAFAHVGDAVFELMVRTWICMHGASTAKQIHGKTVAYVSARAQALAAERLMPVLSDEETAVFKRGRNAHVNSIPRGSTHEEYHTATGIETLFGYLYLNGSTTRLDELFELVIKAPAHNEKESYGETEEKESP